MAKIIDHSKDVLDEADRLFQQGLTKATLLVERSAKEKCPVKTTTLRRSITHDIEGRTARVGSNVEYACVVGRQNVYVPEQKTSSAISNFAFDNVLSKDGNSHKITAKYRFSPNNYNAVSIVTRKGRLPLIVTENHLVLILRSNTLMWEKAKNIIQTDKVFGKRSRNAIVDDSNKTKFICPCGEEFWVFNYELKFRTPKYCSSDCRHKFGPHDFTTGMSWSLSEETCKKRRGQNNPQWRDGSCKKPYPREFNGRLKRIILERDGFLCQQCHQDIDLIVHHLNWDKTNNTEENLVTLCRPCHGALNRLDCELPTVNMDMFVEKPILKIEQYTVIRRGKINIPRLYDFTIARENSFMVSGVLVHNSYVELGTSKWAGKPFLRPALLANVRRIKQLFKGK